MAEVWGSCAEPCNKGRRGEEGGGGGGEMGEREGWREGWSTPKVLGKVSVMVGGKEEAKGVIVLLDLMEVKRKRAQV